MDRGKIEKTGQERYRQERQDSAESRKQQVLEMAEVLFLDRGLANVSMNDLIKATGVSRATLYRYFSNMDEIIFAIQKSKLAEIFHRRENVAQPLVFLLNLIDEFSGNQDGYRFIGMFDNHYSDSYPTEEMARDYEDYMHNHDDNITVLHDTVSPEMRTRMVVVMNIVISFLQRLALRGKIFEKYQGIAIEEQLRELKNMVKREFAF